MSTPPKIDWELYRKALSMEPVKLSPSIIRRIQETYSWSKDELIELTQASLEHKVEILLDFALKCEEGVRGNNISFVSTFLEAANKTQALEAEASDPYKRVFGISSVETKQETGGARAPAPLAEMVKHDLAAQAERVKQAMVEEEQVILQENESEESTPTPIEMKEVPVFQTTSKTKAKFTDSPEDAKALIQVIINSGSNGIAMGDLVKQFPQMRLVAIKQAIATAREQGLIHMRGEKRFARYFGGPAK